MPIFVDCDWGKKNNDVSGKFSVRGYPTVVFTDPEGNEVARLAARDAASVARQITEIADKHSKKVPWAESLEKGVEAAKEAKKALAVFFTDGKKDANETEEALAADSIRALHEKLILVRHEIAKDCETCKAYGVNRGSNLIIVDPRAEDPAKEPISKITGAKAPKALKSSLEAALKKWEKMTKDD